MASPPASLPSLLHIQSSYLATSLGDDARTSVAALVAGHRQFRHVPLADCKLSTAPAQDVAGASTGLPRLIALLRAVVAPALAELANTGAGTRNKDLHITLALPAWVTQEQLEEVGAELGAWAQSRRLPEPTVRGALRGPQASFLALRDGWDIITQRPNTVLLLAGADSLCDAPVLQRDHAAGKVHHAHNTEGWIAAEAAAALVLRPVASVWDLTGVQMGLHRPALVPAKAAAPRWPGSAQGNGTLLQAALELALNQAGMQLTHVSHIAGDFEGSSWRAEDLLAALQRIQAREQALWNGQAVDAASQLGQLGAAWGAVQWALSDQLQRLQAQRINSVLSFTQDASGACAAAALERAPH